MTEPTSELRRPRAFRLDPPGNEPGKWPGKGAPYSVEAEPDAPPPVAELGAANESRP